MNEVIRKKLNLLVHLAKIDGKFDQTERDVLSSMLKEAGVPPSEYGDELGNVTLSDFNKNLDQADILYWAIRLIKADGVIHSDESAFCKALAIKLGFNSEVIEYFTHNDVGTKQDFIDRSEQFLK